MKKVTKYQLWKIALSHDLSLENLFERWLWRKSLLKEDTEELLVALREALICIIKMPIIMLFLIISPLWDLFCIPVQLAYVIYTSDKKLSERIVKHYEDKKNKQREQKLSKMFGNIRVDE